MSKTKATWMSEWNLHEGIPEAQRHSHRPANSYLVDYRQALRFLDSVDLQRGPTKLSQSGFHYEPIVSARGAAWIDPLADAIAPNLRGHDVGARNWGILSAAVLLIPMVALAYFVTKPGTPYSGDDIGIRICWPWRWQLFLEHGRYFLFYLDRMKGVAPRLNAAGGDIGAVAFS